MSRICEKRAKEQGVGVTQAELAKRLGFVNYSSHSPVSKMESGQVRVNLVILQRICRALGIPFRAFVLKIADDLESLEGVTTGGTPQGPL